MKKIAILTCTNIELYRRYTSDHLLYKALKKRGLQIEEVIWNAPNIHWQSYDAVLIRSTWDYIEPFKQSLFIKTLKTIAQSGIPLFNPYAVIAWNLHKRYLIDLERLGIPIIPSHFITRKNQPRINTILDTHGGNSWVLKPAISAGAAKTVRVHRDNAQRIYETLYENDEEVIVQPFIREIITGEYELIFFNGIFSHAVLQKPAAGDFRVQAFHGGTTTAIHPSTTIIAEASRALEAARHLTNSTLPFLYARVDLVIHDHKPYIMEIELIEPTLYLNVNPHAADVCAAALSHRLHA